MCVYEKEHVQHKDRWTGSIIPPITAESLHPELATHTHTYLNSFSKCQEQIYNTDKLDTSNFIT